MDVMKHSSAFLLPTVPADHRHSLTYALVVLNQRLPKFTPLLWEHGTLPSPWLSLSPLPSYGLTGDYYCLRDNSVRACVCVEQQNSISVLMEEPTACTMKCLCFFLTKTLWRSEKGICFSFLFFIYLFIYFNVYINSSS